MGDNVYLGDRDGVRTPMQWTGDRNGGFSRADFAQLYAPPLMDPVYGYQAVNVEAQLRTPTSLLRWLSASSRCARSTRCSASARSSRCAEQPADLRPRAPLRGRHRALRAQPGPLAQAVELDLSALGGPLARGDVRPLALPPIGELPYLLTLAPRGFFWFLLREEEREQPTLEHRAVTRD